MENQIKLKPNKDREEVQISLHTLANRQGNTAPYDKFC